MERGVPLPIVFMTGHGDVASCRAALKGGAVDFLEKPIDPEILLDAIGRALARDAQEREAERERAQLQASVASLSVRESRIFEDVVAGKLNKEIASSLGVSERTVKAQRATLIVKLGVDTAAGLERLAEKLRAMSNSRSE